MSSPTHNVELRPRNNTIASYVVIAGIVVLFMIVIGIFILLQQGGVIDIRPAAFFSIPNDAWDRNDRCCSFSKCYQSGRIF